MRSIILSITALIICVSCGSETKNKYLLAFKTTFLAELGDQDYDKFEEQMNNQSIQTEYLNDVIYVSYFEELNACGTYDGDLEINSDTIKLNVFLSSDEVCTSTAIIRITFLIDNPDQKKWTIVK